MARHLESVEVSKLRLKELELMKILLRDRNRHDMESFAQLASALLLTAGLKGIERCEVIENEGIK